MAGIEPTPSKSNDWTTLSPCQLGQGGRLTHGRQGYPPHLAPPLEALAATHGCCLHLLQGRRGHMCLMLVPHVSEDAEEEEEEVTDSVYRARVRAAREAILPQLEPLPHRGTPRQRRTVVVVMATAPRIDGFSLSSPPATPASSSLWADEV
jgi:hypothetical protein